MNKTSPRTMFLLLALLGCLLLAACGSPATVVEVAAATALPATLTPAPATATLPPSATATATALPTETPTIAPSPTPNKTASAEARNTAIAKALNAKVGPDLEKYGIDPADGHVLWAADKDIKLELNSYMENKDHVLAEAGSMTDFVLQSNIAWDTSGALSLCGITFHAAEDMQMGAQNRFFMMRLQFDPGWTIWRWEYGQFQSYLNGGWVSSRDIHDENGSKNTVGLVVRGKDIDLYINHDHQRKMEDTRLTEGLIALSAYQESGKTKCRFQDTWVWAFDK